MSADDATVDDAPEQVDPQEPTQLAEESAELLNPFADPPPGVTVTQEEGAEPDEGSDDPAEAYRRALDLYLSGDLQQALQVVVAVLDQDVATELKPRLERLRRRAEERIRKEGGEPAGAEPAGGAETETQAPDDGAKDEGAKADEDAAANADEEAVADADSVAAEDGADAAAEIHPSQAAVGEAEPSQAADDDEELGPAPEASPQATSDEDPEGDSAEENDAADEGDANEGDANEGDAEIAAADAAEGLAESPADLSEADEPATAEADDGDAAGAVATEAETEAEAEAEAAATQPEAETAEPDSPTGAPSGTAEDAARAATAEAPSEATPKAEPSGSSLADSGQVAAVAEEPAGGPPAAGSSAGAPSAVAAPTRGAGSARLSTKTPPPVQPGTRPAGAQARRGPARPEGKERPSGRRGPGPGRVIRKQVGGSNPSNSSGTMRAVGAPPRKGASPPRRPAGGKDALRADLERLHDGVDTVSRGMRALQDNVHKVAEAYQRISRMHKRKEQAYDQLYDELRSYKDNFLAKAQMPLFKDLILLYDGLSRSIRTYGDGEGDVPREEVVTRLQTVLEEVLEILYRRDIEPIEERPEILDIEFQKPVKRIETEDPDQDRKIAQVVRDGFRMNGAILRPQEVVVMRCLKERETQ